MAIQIDSANSVALTASQQSMLTASMRGPVDPPYLLQLILPLTAEITESAWLAAWQRVVIAHPLLRMGYAGSNPWIASPEKQVEWVSEDLSHLAPAAYHKETERRFSGDRQVGFDLSETSTQTLCRCMWVHPPPEELPLWCLTIHHALVDGNSLAPLVEQVIHALEDSALLPSESLFLERARLVKNTDWADAREFFRRSQRSQAPAGYPGEHLPRGMTRDSNSKNIHRVALSIDADLMQQVGAANETRPDTLIHAAWSLMLSRITDGNQVVFGVIRHCRGRRSEGLRDALGPFSNMLPLCIEVPENQSVASWLSDISDTWQALSPYENCPLQEIQLAMQGGEHKSRGFETLVNVVRETPVIEIERVLGKHASSRPVFHQKTDLPMSLVMHLQPTLGGVLVARNDCFSLPQTEMLSHLFVKALREIITRSSATVCELSLESPSSLKHSRGYEVEYSATNVLALLHGTVSKHSNAIALSTPNQSLNFEQLWQLADTFAATLDAKGVQPENVVAILTGRSVDTVVAVIGSLRAGAAFFIVNEDLPQKQQIENIRAADSRFLVITSEDSNSFKDQINDIERIHPPQVAQQAVYPDTAPKAKDLAYLVATSGTTGSPNIVMIEHGSLLNLIQGYADVLHPSVGDIRYQSVSASSDTFVLEVMLYLCFGASLHIETGLLKVGFGSFGQSLQQRGITIIGLPSSLWREWAEQQIIDRSPAYTEKRSIRAVICSMERTDPDTLHTWREQSGRGLLWINAYGPSEAACVACLFPLQIGDATPEGEIPIGRPLPNVQIYVLDSKRRSMPMGIIGEIAIGGAGVARGYANNPEKTKEKFIPDPFATNVKAQLYLTGDLGYFREDGNLVFVGRSDNQVKIRGHRIELEEVELALARYSLVQDAAAVTVSHDHSCQLIAFYTSDSNPNTRTLRTHLLTQLPIATIPHRLVKRDIIPRDRLGKVSRQQLSQEAAELISSESLTNDDSPEWKESDSLETQLSHLFGRVLDIHSFDVQDDFFLCGGDSLNAVVLLTEIEKQSGHTLSINDLFLHPTPEDLAARLGGRAQPSLPRSLIPLSSGGGTAAPLLFFHGYNGDLFQQIPLAKILGADRPIWGLQAIEYAGEERDASVEAMAARYAAEIINQFGGNPCYLCGYSLGGLIAFETAKQLIQQGFPIKRLLIIDSLPFNLPMTPHLKMHGIYLRQRLGYHVEKLVREQHNVFSYTRDRFQGLRRLISRNNNSNKDQNKTPETESTNDYYAELAFQYQPKPLPLKTTLFKSTSGMRDPSPGWRYLTTKKLRVVPVHWQHLAIMQEEAREDLATLFRLEMER